MIFNISIDDDKNNEYPHSWFFDFNIPYHIKKDYEKPYIRKQDYYCPIICYGVDVDGKDVVSSNKILVPRNSIVKLKLCIREVPYYIDCFKFCYLNQTIYTNKYTKTKQGFKFRLNIRG